MKAKIDAQIQTLVELQAEFSGKLCLAERQRIIPAGEIGTVIECYTSPEEGYAVDIALPNQVLVGEASYENIILYPDQFRVISSVKTDLSTPV
jgi:hypothetical protein